RLQELAFLNRGIKIILEDQREGKEQSEEFQFDGGIRSFVEYLNRNREVLHSPPIYIEGTKESMLIEAALQYNDSFSARILSFANNIHTHEGGTHESGFKSALTRVINDYARRNNLLKDQESNLTGDDVREGITA